MRRRFIGTVAAAAVSIAAVVAVAVPRASAQTNCQQPGSQQLPGCGSVQGAPYQGEVFRGAARGAAKGALVGSISGNAGRGAAIGAATGGVFSAGRRAASRY